MHHRRLDLSRQLRVQDLVAVSGTTKEVCAPEPAPVEEHRLKEKFATCRHRGFGSGGCGLQRGAITDVEVVVGEIDDVTASLCGEARELLLLVPITSSSHQFGVRIHATLRRLALASC